MYNLEEIRQDFPILGRQVYNRPLVYLDNAATTQKPRCVVEAIAEEYYSVNANVHRGVHYLSQQATDLHEDARNRVKDFINARSAAEVVFTRGTTESLNLVAASFGEAFLKEGDEVILSVMEHHSNIVPWQLLRERKGIVIKVIPMDEVGNLCLDVYETLFSERTKLVCVAHVSNVLGTVNPVEEMARTAHKYGAFFLVDGAQSVPHFKVDVQQLNCDFLTFSGHKVYGPTGIGVLYGREELLERMPPYQGGGEMIARVTFEHTTYERLPYKFEAGTPDYVGSHALAVALDYVTRLGMDNIAAHERELTRYAMKRMREIDSMKLYGETVGKDAVVAFNVGDIHPLDLGTLLDRLGIAIRTGHHCAQPLMARCGVEGMARASFALYNTKEEVDVLVEGIKRVSRMF
ncbi:cysteine desulfurase [Bacteroidaceae bacterium]|uniref:cysteine desulfurase n=1 Tax=Prevotella sp. MGM2 TaxID=2033406 RepID=UPI000CEA024D|nr:cysteine desulfurase [Prevotella sp. MGM2]GAY31348.1 cysteine desulfurase [Prevotella sp. MGM2]GFI34026.1 cysteine desulfurase [Bacteroidaceae bacterium]